MMMGRMKNRKTNSQKMTRNRSPPSAFDRFSFRAASSATLAACSGGSVNWVTMRSTPAARAASSTFSVPSALARNVAWGWFQEPPTNDGPLYRMPSNLQSGHFAGACSWWSQ